MKFLRPRRVRYAKNPLIEVACEIRFPIQLSLQESLPIDFQKSIAQDFPILELQSELEIEFMFDPNDAENSGRRGLKKNQTTSYSFSSVDHKWVVTLSSQAIRLSTESYLSWEEFETRLVQVLIAFQENYSVDYFTRIGLRYRDLIDRKILACEEVAWPELVNSQVFSTYNSYGFAEQDYLDFQQNVSIKLDIGTLAARHGFVRHVEKKHTAFLIDAEFHLDEITKAGIDHVADILRDFNVQAGGFFRASISDRLHQLLEPTELT